MDIAGMVKSTLVDYPDHLACTLFVGGCNYNCFYCHNRPLLGGVRERIDPKVLWDFLQKRRGQLDGVVISGGEPTLRPDLMLFIRKIKEMGYKVKLDTNGSNPNLLAQLTSQGFLDYAAVDYKAPLMRYREICGRDADARTVLQSIDVLQKSNTAFEVRTTVIPQLSLDDLLIMAQELPIVSRYVLNRYRPPETYLPADRDRIAQKPYTQAEIKDFADMLRGIQPHVMT